MRKVIQYRIIEDHPGWYHAEVQRQGIFRKYWKGLGVHAEETDYPITEFGVQKTELLIERHKREQIKPFVPNVMYREPL